MIQGYSESCVREVLESCSSSMCAQLLTAHQRGVRWILPPTFRNGSWTTLVRKGLAVRDGQLTRLGIAVRTVLVSDS